MSGQGAGLLVELLKSVARLSWPAAAQIHLLGMRGLLPSTDELALELNDLVGVLPQFVANGWLSEADASAITELDEMLGRISGAERSNLWTAQALEESSEWEAVRRAARAIIAG